MCHKAQQRTPHSINITTPPPFPHALLSLLLPSVCRPRLCCLFPITPYHNDAQEAPYDCRSEQDENDWYANGPDAGREEVVERVALIDKGLFGKADGVVSRGSLGRKRWDRYVR